MSTLFFHILIAAIGLLSAVMGIQGFYDPNLSPGDKVIGCTGSAGLVGMSLWAFCVCLRHNYPQFFKR